ncbi:hypothetical protein, partial [Citrobacter freundii]|uniref:hypothetical protein n=1 Tax=Citrobacter freundii TaxID=546 RepID=UPI003AACAB62
ISSLAWYGYWEEVKKVRISSLAWYGYWEEVKKTGNLKKCLELKQGYLQYQFYSPAGKMVLSGACR